MIWEPQPWSWHVVESKLSFKQSMSSAPCAAQGPVCRPSHTAWQSRKQLAVDAQKLWQSAAPVATVDAASIVAVTEPLGLPAPAPEASSSSPDCAAPPAPGGSMTVVHATVNAAIETSPLRAQASVTRHGYHGLPLHSAANVGLIWNRISMVAPQSVGSTMLMSAICSVHELTQPVTKVARFASLKAGQS